MDWNAESGTPSHATVTTSAIWFPSVVGAGPSRGPSSPCPAACRSWTTGSTARTWTSTSTTASTTPTTAPTVDQKHRCLGHETRSRPPGARRPRIRSTGEPSTCRPAVRSRTPSACPWKPHPVAAQPRMGRAPAHPAARRRPAASPKAIIYRPPKEGGCETRSWSSSTTKTPQARTTRSALFCSFPGQLSYADYMIRV